MAVLRDPVMRLILFFLVILVTAGNAVATEDLAVIVRQATVYSKADASAPAITRLPAGTEVSIFSRQGGWKEVFSDKLQVVGWVRGYEVREGVTVTQPEVEKSPDSRGFLSGLASLSRRAGGFFGLDGSSTTTSSSTATIGIRGLSEQEIYTAQADFEQLEKMKGYASSKKRQGDFARLGKLKPVKIRYIK